MTLFSAIVYSLSVVTLSMVATSYILAYKLSPRLHILSLALFFLTVLFLALSSAVKLWSLIVFGHHSDIGTAELRGILLLASSSMLLYTTWKKN